MTQTTPQAAPRNGTAAPDTDAGAPAADAPGMAYDPQGSVNVPGHRGSLAAYAALVGSALLVGGRRGRRLPERYPLADLLVGGLATHKLSRLLTKGSVASPVRAPFTRFEEASGAGEHLESPRGHAGVRHTVGELLTCPFCLGVWLGTGYVAGLALAPRQTRATGALFSIVAASDWLQLLYDAARSRALGDD